MNTRLKAGQKACGYKIIKISELPEIKSVYFRLMHEDTGAEHIHIENKDKENTFSVAFKTVPKDSTGVAHILEHTALCGSKKFPVRDPFFSMIKRSLSTFMNAFTASDWTMYPFSTQNRKDFYNLMDVYLDAAFFPNLSELSFKQEGHRIEIDPEGVKTKLSYKGVVYNEMKGAMSSPYEVMVRSILNALYPDSTYRFNSGGEPSSIPDLTHSQLVDFHKYHYHPSNAFFYTYGDIPLTDHLEFIRHKILKHFDRIDPNTEVKSQPRWQKPRNVLYHYPLSKREDPQKKYQVCAAWLNTDIRDSFEVLVLTLLTRILLGNAGSPLRKALIESQLGSALCDGNGFDADNRDTSFATGLKDVKMEDAVKIEEIILDVLKDLSVNGIDKKMIESAIHQIEFHRKEVTNSPYPYGIKLLLAFSGTWFHRGDPEEILLFDSSLKKIKKAIAEGPFFENKIKQHFLDNPHRIRLTLCPDQEMEEKQNIDIQTHLAQLMEKMSRKDLAGLENDALALKSLQESDDDISCLPTLELKDIPREIQTVNETGKFGDLASAVYPQPTSDIFYYSAAAGIQSLPNDLIPLIPLFCSALPRIGTEIHDYTEMAQLIDAYTGGIGLAVHARNGFENAANCIPFISLNGKCLIKNQEKMFEILEELINRFNFSNLNRLKSILLEHQAGMESMIVKSGHRLAISLASRSFSPVQSLNETWYGIHQLQAIKKITSALSNDAMADGALKKLSDDLTAIGKILFKPGNIKTALIGEDSALSSCKKLQTPIFFKTPNAFNPPEINFDSQKPREGWHTSTSVSFVATTFQTKNINHEDSAALAVISKIMRSMYLHREIREKGGAYGGFSIYSPETGIFCLASYRDPHITGTLRAFDGAAAFIKSEDYTEDDVKEAILQVCSDIDKPDSPGTAAVKAFHRKIIGFSDDIRKKYKEKLFKLTLNQIRETARIYFRINPSEQAVAVISGEEKLQQSNQEMKAKPLKLFKI